MDPPLMQDPPQRPLVHQPRRSVSFPVRRCSNASTTGPESSLVNRNMSNNNNNNNNTTSNGENIDLLYAHSDARIVSFTSSSLIPAGKLLEWTSPTERTIASGPLRVYKTIPHDIAFLQSGSALRPVLSRSQCWNVDGRGVFCLQIRPGNYWRLEILESEDGEAVKGIQFGKVLAKILAYEVTACPFKRVGRVVPVAEVFESLQPSKVWKRPRAATITRGSLKEKEIIAATAVVEKVEGFEDKENKRDCEAVVATTAEKVEVVEDEQKDKAIETVEDLVSRKKLTEDETEAAENPKTAESTKPIDIASRPTDTLPPDTILSTTPEEFNKDTWEDISPTSSPSRLLKCRNLPIARSSTAPPQLSDVNVFSASPPSRSISPIQWYIPYQHTEDMKLTRRRTRKTTSFSLESPTIVEAPETSPTPSSAPALSSGSDSEDCFDQEDWTVRTPPPLRPLSTFHRPSTAIPRPSTAIPHQSAAITHQPAEIPRPLTAIPRPATSSTLELPSPALRRSSSSSVLNIVGATANLVIKPSAFIASLMFSIASKIASRAVTGAGYTLRRAATGDAVKEYDEEEFYDDYGVRIQQSFPELWGRETWTSEID
ncbi:hypothetical protein RUND412_008571 [Rhizina undulata]